MIRLDVWLGLTDGAHIRAGELVCEDADGQGRYASAFRYVAEYLADPRAFAKLPVSELALRSHVSKPTVVRFCRTLGYEGWHEFKLKLAQGLALAIDPYAEGPTAEDARRKAGLLDEGSSGPFAALKGLLKD